MDIHAVDLHGFVRGDQDVLHAPDDPGLDHVRTGGIHTDHRIRGLHLEMLVVDDILGVQRCVKAESGIVVYTEFGHVLLGNPAVFQHALYILFPDEQRIGDLALLVELDTLAQLIMDGLYNIHAALLPQGIGKQLLKALFLLRGGLGNGNIE